MTEIHYQKFPAFLRHINGGKKDTELASVILIYGEEYICKQVFDELLKQLLPESSKSLNYEPVDGTDEGMKDAIQRMNTYSLIPGRKVVAIVDSHLFHSSRDTSQILDLAKRAFVNDQMKKAAGILLNLMGLMNLSIRESALSADHLASTLGLSKEADAQWLDDLLAYIRAKGMSESSPKDGTRVLQEAIEKGFPAGNHLIVLTDVVDKRRRIYKSIDRDGIVVDCSVPSGNRRADRKAQESVLTERMEALLEKAQKRVEPKAYRIMVEKTGFDLRGFLGNLEKLISFVGERETITRDDVEQVLDRTKRDPLYEFTNAVTDKQFDNALFYMHSLLSDSAFGHPLQLLGAMVNQIRKLLVVKGFAESQPGRVWYAGCPYPYFQNKVIPEIQMHDEKLMDILQTWEERLSSITAESETENQKPSRGIKKGRLSTDLLIAKNPRNAYPIYRLFEKSIHFTKLELFEAMHHLSRADQRIKAGVQNPVQVVEKAVLSICLPRSNS